jgi:hypothetical protein
MKDCTSAWRQALLKRISLQVRERRRVDNAGRESKTFQDSGQGDVMVNGISRALLFYLGKGCFVFQTHLQVILQQGVCTKGR